MPAGSTQSQPPSSSPDCGETAPDNSQSTSRGIVPPKLKQWLFANRTTVRLAFILRLFSMAVNSTASLAWTRLLLRVMGDHCFGLFMSFQSAATLGGLGDFGITGALAIRTGQAMARGEQESLRRFLAGARSLFLLMIMVLSGLYLVLSPWLPGWLGFKPAPGAGSLVLLFATAAPSLVVGLSLGYVNALNGGFGTVTWPILPMLFFVQIGLALQWTVAALHLPLWIQNLVAMTPTAAAVLAGWGMLKVAHPWLGDLRPLLFDRSIWRDLGKTSGWAYLYNLGSAIYVHTDRVLINAGFGAAVVPKYMLNAKLCDLAYQIISVGCGVSLPKINQWLASPDPEHRKKGVAEIRRLNIFQTMLASGGAIAYLIFNDAFVHLWLGPAYIAPLTWQIAFAMNLTITASGNASVQIAGVCGKKGLSFTGLTIGWTGLLNFGLSFLSMKYGSILGIAVATVIAQSLLVILLGWKLCDYLEIGLFRWTLNSWLLPVLIVGAACVLRVLFPPVALLSYAILIGSGAILLVILSVCIGLNVELISHEVKTLWKMLGGK